jgi:hypothetical protein
MPVASLDVICVNGGLGKVDLLLSSNTLTKAAKAVVG